MADNKTINTEEVQKYVSEQKYGDKLRNPDKVATLVATAFSSVKDHGFLPIGDFRSDTGRTLASQWNESLKNLYDQITSPSNAILNPYISYQTLLEADAKGTEIKRYLDPTPLRNRLNQTYEDARSDEFPMNVMHMDYTNDLGEYTKSREFQYAIQLFSLFDFNGDGVLDGQAASYDDSKAGTHKGDMLSGLRFLLTYDVHDETIPLYKFITSIPVEKEFEDGSVAMTELTGNSLRNYLIDCLNEGSKQHNSYEGVDRVSYLYECINDEGESGFFVFNAYKEEHMEHSYQVNPLIISPNGPYKTAYSKIMEVVGETEEERKNKIYKIISKIAEETIHERYEKMTEIERRLNRTSGKQIYITYMMRALLQNGSNRNYIRYRDAAEYLFQSDEYQAIRLLMPQYARRVEVEDLNKNFWVIGQVLDALTQGLLGPNGVYSSLEQMLEELGQLWQNTSYIWNLLATVASSIDDLSTQLEQLKMLLGFGKTTSVSWSLDSYETPTLSLYEPVDMDKFGIVIKNTYGQRILSGFIDNSRFCNQDTMKRIMGEADGKPTFPHIGNKYDMIGAVQKFNTYVNLTNKRDNPKIPFSLLIENTTNQYTLAGFRSGRVIDMTKEKDDMSLLSVFLNNNVNDYFRMAKKFSIILYDNYYYDYYETKVEQPEDKPTRTLGKLKYKTASIDDDTPEELVNYCASHHDAESIIFFIPRSDMNDGELIRIDFDELCMQQNTPKRVDNTQESINSNLLDSYWNESRLNFWKTTYFYQGGHRTVDGKERMVYDLNNIIKISYRSNSMEAKEGLFYHAPMDVQVYRNGLKNRFTNNNFDQNLLTTISDFPYKQIETKALYNQSFDGLYTVQGTPGYKTSGGGRRNYAQEFISGSMSGCETINSGYVAREGSQTQTASIYDIALFKDNLKKNPSCLIPALHHYGQIQPEGKYYRPYSGVWIKHSPFSFEYDVHINMARIVLENTNITAGASGINRIGMYGISTQGVKRDTVREKNVVTGKLNKSVVKEVDGKMVSADEEMGIGENYPGPVIVIENIGFIGRDVAFTFETTIGSQEFTNDPTQNGLKLYQPGQKNYHYNYPRAQFVGLYGQLETPCIMRNDTLKEGSTEERFNTFSEDIKINDNDVINYYDEDTTGQPSVPSGPSGPVEAKIYNSYADMPAAAGYNFESQENGYPIESGWTNENILSKIKEKYPNAFTDGVAILVIKQGSEYFLITSDCGDLEEIKKYRSDLKHGYLKSPNSETSTASYFKFVTQQSYKTFTSDNTGTKWWRSARYTKTEVMTNDDFKALFNGAKIKDYLES